MPAGKHPYGTTISARTNAAGGAYTQVGDVMSATLGETKVTINEIKHLLLTNAKIEKIAGLVNEGALKLQIHFNKTKYNTIRGQLRVYMDFQVAVPGTDGGTATFSGYWFSLSMELPDDAPIMIPAEAEVSGEITWTPAT